MYIVIITILYTHICHYVKSGNNNNNEHKLTNVGTFRFWPISTYAVYNKNNNGNITFCIATNKCHIK